ncbi:Alfin [Parasponia andersonii]|uniref:PHD finger protein ALFIN-LIKE n=1 Tax=Parasponia andersonii TaxID=3476 RepID=A0A2P5BHU6_PARAD|nr:Alfin [Parasponia andersonii]
MKQRRKRRGQPFSVEEVFENFRARRAGIVKALTSEEESLCPFGLPSGDWQVAPPADDVPSQLPEPAIGINFSRDGKAEWSHTIAARSDSWLLEIAFFVGCGFHFDKDQRHIVIIVKFVILGCGTRERLLFMINDLPTAYEIVTSPAKKQLEENSTVPNDNTSNKFKPSSKEQGIKLGNHIRGKTNKDGEQTVCGACRKEYAAGEFWICCHICQTWYHGVCVNITPAKAQHINQYKCPVWTSKRARP